MPELVTPDGKSVPVPDPSPPRPPADPEQVNRDFSRAMAAEDPSAAQPPPPRGDKPEPAARRRGRPAKDEKSRTEKAAKAPPAKVDTDYTEALAGITTLAWSGLAAIPYTTPYAAVVDANQPQLVSALNAAAQNNAAVREQVERLASGGGGVWAIQLAAVGVNMTMQTLQIMKDPQVRKEATAATQAKFRAFLKAQGVDVEQMEQEAAGGQPAAA